MNKKFLAVFTMVLVLAAFVVLPTTAVLATRGDANTDNEIDMKDVLVVRKVVATLSLEHDHIAADVNADGDVDMKDVLLLRKYIAGDVTAVLAPYPSESSTSEISTVVTTTTTKAPTTTTTTAAPVVTTTTNGGGSGDEVTLSFSFVQQGRYSSDDVTISKEWTYNRGDTATINAQIVFYNGSGKSLETVLEYFNWTSNNLTYVSFNESPIVDHNTTYTITYSILMDSDKTVTGNSNDKKQQKYSFDTNGAGGTDVTTTTTRATGASGNLGYHHEPTGSETIDMVTLTFNDQTSSTYGINFHSFNQLGNNAVVQYVQGAVTDPAAFSSATVIHPNESTYAMKEYTNYNATDFTFDYNWSNRASMVYNITTYGYDAALTGLTPNTTYSYRVGDSANDYYSPIYTFTTKPATVTDFSFIYTADTQPELGDAFGYRGVNALFNLAYATDPDCAFQVSGGDFVYCSDEGQGTVSMWRNMLNGGNSNTGAANSLFAENPWMICNGNHDNDFVQRFFNNTSAGGSGTDYFSWDYGDAHFIVIDTGHSGNVSSAQLTWLEQDLAATNKKWKIAFMHWPLYCNTYRDLSGTAATTMKSLFDTYGLDVCINAHVNADYFTSYPVKAGAKVCDPVVSNGVSNYTNPGGTIYMQNGASGLGSNLQNGIGVMYTKDGMSNSYPELMQHFEAGYEGSFAVISFEGNQLIMDRYYYMNGNAIKYTNGQFTITKN